MDLISKINQKTLIIVPNTYLLKQWVELLTQYFPENTIGEYYGKTKRGMHTVTEYRCGRQPENIAELGRGQ